MKTAKILGCFLLLFTLGAASGIAITRRDLARRFLQRPGIEKQWIEKRFEEDVKRLQLTPEQQQTFRAQYDELASDFRSIREETAKHIRESLVRRGTELHKVLSPEQREQFRQLNEERRNRWKRGHP
jgi:Spy/CpxP family protein refolding chaperone